MLIRFTAGRAGKKKGGSLLLIPRAEERATRRALVQFRGSTPARKGRILTPRKIDAEIKVQHKTGKAERRLTAGTVPAQNNQGEK